MIAANAKKPCKRRPAPGPGTGRKGLPGPKNAAPFSFDSVQPRCYIAYLMRRNGQVLGIQLLPLGSGTPNLLLFS